MRSAPGKIRSHKSILFALLFALHTVALADDASVARLVEVRGNVLVSGDSSLASVDEGVRLLPGWRVLTTADAAAVVQFDDGCRVPVERNQRFVVLSHMPCATRVAMPLPSPQPARAPLTARRS